uniref:Coiled-coil domain containing 57 n=1 Tax=Varanus komodoensis TaxID=61221 RepID=A0A8D2IYW9_VARKO
MLHTEQDLNELLICKEQELKELQARQTHFHRATLQETQRQLQEMNRKFNVLKEDFTYNLKLLQERDKELEHYDTLFTQLKMVENVKQAEVSDLKIKIDKLEQALAQETKKQEALQYQYQQKLKEHQLELEHLHSSKDSDISHHCEKYENMKHQLERKLTEIESELALQRQELLVEFDAEMKKREHEFRQKADEMSNIVLSHELKVKLLTKELEALKQNGIKMAESLKVAEATNLELEKEVKCKDWEIKDLAAVKDVRIQDLENKLELLQLSWKKDKEIFERKHAAIDHCAREKDALIASVKETHAEQIHKLENQIGELQIDKETLEMELHRSERRHTDHLKEKEAIIEKFRQGAALKTSLDSQTAQISREAVSKDLQIQAFQEEELKLRAQLASLLQHIERYKQELSLAAEREAILERAKVQTELDWQRHCENAERNQYQKSEALIHSLSTARDQLTAELHEKERELHELERISSAVTLERDKAIQKLQKLDHLPKGEKQPTVEAIELGFPSTEIQRLQEQNNNLRAVIAEMRREMETLNNQALPSEHTKLKMQDADGTDSTAVVFTPDYVQSLEEEIRKLKKKIQAMDKQHETLSEVPEKIFVSSLSSKCNKSTQISQLQKNSVNLRPQLLGMGAGDGLQQHTGNHVQMMQGKLKEAVRKICSLSTEKQQLLEMVNRLRAELGAPSKKGKHTEGRLSFPQVQLESFVQNCTADLSNPDTLVPHQSKQLKIESPSLFQPDQLSSSGAHSSLEEIWQILEMGSSPSFLSSQKSPEKHEASFIQQAPVPPLTVRGSKFDVQPKLKPHKSSYSHSRKPQISQRTTRIRNYNVKD